MVLLALLLAAGPNVPVIDHAKAVRVRPINRDVVMCHTPTALPLARLATQALNERNADYGYDKIMANGGCMPVFSTDALYADFQEDVAWTGALRPPQMLSGVIRVVRVRFPVEVGNKSIDAYAFIAAEDLTR